MLGRKSKHLSIDTAALTDTGMVRKNNEDNVFALDIREPNTFGKEYCGIYLVADGMGGHQAGEGRHGLRALTRDRVSASLSLWSVFRFEPQPRTRLATVFPYVPRKPRRSGGL